MTAAAAVGRAGAAPEAATAPRVDRAAGASLQGASLQGASLQRAAGPARTAAPASAALPSLGWHEAVLTFKRQLLARALARAGGNRTRAARALGLQRTYLLRLLRQLEVTDPR